MSDLRKKNIAKSKETEAAIIKHQSQKEWLAENRAAIESSNAWVDKHGLPLARYRQF